MARYTGPTSRIARRFGEPIFGPDKALAKKAYAPGQHGNQRRRGKESAYGVQLMEKQKAKFTYGILEKQFSNLFKEALRRKGVTGENLLQMCEMRLDNVIFRLGIAPTRRSARQLVTHNHITVNNDNVNIPSFALKVGDLVSVRERSKSLEVIENSVSANRDQMEWLEFNSETKVGKVIAAPERIQIPENIKEQVIVELYSK
jgi:small subunit ribosomal protein S4